MGAQNGQMTTDVMEATLALEPQIKDAGKAIETERRLPPAVVQGMRDAGVFRMAAPREHGGLELDPLTQIKVVEELSRMDGSVGWCAMIGASVGYIRAFMEPAAVNRLFSSCDAVAAGQVPPRGRAEVVDGGYRVSGRWSFASGCQHSEVIMAGCLICENGEPRRLADGQPETRMILAPVSSCTIIDTWDTTGLRGTGSHDYKLEDVFVPATDTFSFFDPPRYPSPLYALPQLFLANHAGVPLGIARAAIDTVVELSAHKIMWPANRPLREEGQVQEAIAYAEASLGAARSYTFSVMEDIWETLCRGETLSLRQRGLFRIMLVYIHRVAKEVVESMYDTASTSSVFRSHLLDRQMRDILTACQHRVLQANVYKPGGRMLLGLDPGAPFF
jgi:indole-3-acetate monooxygenase